jgi:DNA-directed RNA polymerase subunit RPC12/RpoP
MKRPTKSQKTKWKCSECGRWFNQGVFPEGMNKISCPECNNSYWLYLSEEDIEKIKVND